MADDVQFRLCFKNMAVPVEKTTLDVVDPEGMLDDLPDGGVSVSLVSFKATSDMHWLSQGLGVPVKWWLRNHCKTPLVDEILKSIKNLRPTKGSQRLLRKNHTSLVPLKIRGKIILCVNSPRAVTLALQEGKERDVLSWFLELLKNDVEAMEDGSAPQVDRKFSKTSVPEEISKAADDAIEDLQDHLSCQKIIFVPSRCCFRVNKKGLPNFREFRVKDLEKALKAEDYEGASNKFAFAAQQILEFLDGVPASGPQDPQPAPEASQASQAVQEAEAQASQEAKTQASQEPEAKA